LALKAPVLLGSVGGAEGIRTPDPLDANEVRYQLRHSPEKPGAALSGRGSG
jgi:hypothetical protein